MSRKNANKKWNQKFTSRDHFLLVFLSRRAYHFIIEVIFFFFSRQVRRS